MSDADYYKAYNAIRKNRSSSRIPGQIPPWKLKRGDLFFEVDGGVAVRWGCAEDPVEETRGVWVFRAIRKNRTVVEFRWYDRGDGRNNPRFLREVGSNIKVLDE